MNNSTSDFGLHTGIVPGLLQGIESRQLLRFGKPLSDLFIPVNCFEEAMAIAQGESDEGVCWTEIRDQADASMDAVGLLDTPAWAAYKDAISGLLSKVAHCVDAALPVVAATSATT